MNKTLFVTAIGIAFNIAHSPVNAATSAFQETVDSIITSLPKELWDLVDRETARFPSRLAIENTGGCATVEYTLTPDNQITNVSVVSASRSNFAEAAHNAIKKWDFDAVKGSLTDIEIKTQTRFEFCIAGHDTDCSSERASFCSGDDVILVVSKERADDKSLERVWTYERKKKRVE